MKPEELYKDVNQKQNEKLAIPDKSEGLWLQALHPVAAVKRNPQLYWPCLGFTRTTGIHQTVKWAV